MLRTLSFILLFCIIIQTSVSTDKPKKKDVRDFTDADLEKLFEEWEANDEDELEEDEKPPELRKKPPIDLDSFSFAGGTPEDMLKQAKKGQPLMMFVGIVDPSGKEPTNEYTENLIKLWQTSLYNNHIECQMFVVESNRVIMMIQEGSLAFDARDFLLKQEQVADITLEGKVSEGAGHKYLKKEEKNEL